MAEILVSVLESPYTVLQRSGIPLPVCLCMQGKGLQLEDAQWTARQSNGGFSVTFFWPALIPSEADLKATVPVVKKKTKQRRKRKAKAQPHRDTQEATVAHHAEEKTSFATTITPVNAHQHSIVNLDEHATSSATNCSTTPGTKSIQHNEISANSSVEVTARPAPVDLASCESASPPTEVTALPAPVDLTTCESVSYEMRERIPGVKYMKDGIEGWTPVRKRSRRRKNSDHDSDTSSDTSGSELDVSCSRVVKYSVSEGVPGISIFRRNVTWKPIMPSPVASRTRSRIKN